MEFDMDVKRWDPISGTAASTLGIVSDFTASLGGLFIDPYKAYKQASAKSKGSANAAGKATVAVGGSFAKMSGVLVRGTLVDTPLALAEGMRNIPRLYGDEVKDYGKVTDWKSGGTVAAKVGHPAAAVAAAMTEVARR